jgi:hypothetical protein
MAALKKIDMMEATRLTREGRLQEALRLLLGASMGSPGFDESAPERALDVSPPTPEFMPRQRDVTMHRNPTCGTFPTSGRTSESRRFPYG